MENKDKLINEDKVIKCLLALGKTEASVVKKLTTLGIKGQKGNDKSCPIANYIRVKNSTFSNTVISVDDYRIELIDNHKNSELIILDNFGHISDFIRAFDDGEYPKLEKESF